MSSSKRNVFVIRSIQMNAYHASKKELNVNQESIKDEVVTGNDELNLIILSHFYSLFTLISLSVLDQCFFALYHQYLS